WVPQATIEDWISGKTVSTYDPHAAKYNCDDPSVSGTHGTLVLDIAAGNGNGTGIKGVAPKADIIFVQTFVSPLGGSRYIDGVTVLSAVGKVMTQLQSNAISLPIVFNVSLGGNDGPHDSTDHGNSVWSTTLSSLFQSQKGLALVWSAGNQFGE